MRAAAKYLVALAAASGAPLALAAEEGSHASADLNYYEIILNTFGIAEKWVPTAASLLITVVLVLIGLAYSAAVSKDDEIAAPDGKFGLRHLVESICDFVYGIAKDNCGHYARNYFPLLASLFLFILMCNLSGLVPGFEPATVTMEMNVAMGLVVFVVYNYAGLKEHGAGYIKHFLGPVAFIAPLYFLIELVSHFSRPLSLGLRLTGNIFGDHTLLGVFTKLTYVVLPALLMFFGLLVAVVQSFVFTLLTGIYISMATSHDH